MISAKVIEDSISQDDKRITTLQLVYPRLVHSEFMTHRVFSRNASSSRAIPVKKMIEMVRNDPAMPVHWGTNKPGMQAGEELTGKEREDAIALWMNAANSAADIAKDMMNLCLHKQVANRILEPFQHISVVMTATEFDNFYALRKHNAADPNIQALSVRMHNAMRLSKPVLLRSGEWHMPYVTAEEHNTHDIETLLKVSSARCARVSYLKHDGTQASVEDEIELYNQLMTRPFTDKRGFAYGVGDPIHASPVEHQATPDTRVTPDMICGGWEKPHLHGNFVGWIQNRKLIERSFCR